MAAPVNTVLPVISGSVAIGQSLALSDGTWTGSPTSYAYAWLREGVAVAGATFNAYTLSADDVGYRITGRVTATNGDGSTAASSAATAAVPSFLETEAADQFLAGADVGIYTPYGGAASAKRVLFDMPNAEAFGIAGTRPAAIVLSSDFSAWSSQDAIVIKGQSYRPVDLAPMDDGLFSVLVLEKQ